MWVTDNLEWDISQSWIQFRFSGKHLPRMPLSSNEPEVQVASEPIEAWSTLEELWAENRMVEQGPGKWMLPFDEIHSLESSQLYYLNIPHPVPLRVRVSVQGIPGHEGLSLEVDVEDIKLGRLVGTFSRKGPFYISIDGNILLTTAPLYELLKLANKGPESDEHESHFQFLAKGLVRIPRQLMLDIYENLEELEFDLPPIESLGIHIKWEDLPDIPISNHFNGQLKTHQVAGYRWLSQLDSRCTGGLLADEMGLGKTVQVIAHMARLAEENRLKPCLIVCPKTLMYNWYQEIHRFFPDHGSVFLAEGGTSVGMPLMSLIS